MQRAHQKTNGIHYTPVHLAEFLAGQMLPYVPQRKSLRVLDPACGDGELLRAMVEALDAKFADVGRSLTAFDTDKFATVAAKKRLTEIGGGSVTTRNEDFIDFATGIKRPSFDCVISNPPYVRTQVMGGKKSQRLAQKFGLTGRVDLYQAFAVAMSSVLKPGGVLGLLTSNRFLTVKSGAVMRELLSDNFELKEVFDLGDTRLFNAAVLPVIVIAVKKVDAGRKSPPCGFHRVYREGNGIVSQQPVANRPRMILNAVAGRRKRTIQSGGERFHIERGSLFVGDAGVWSLTTPSRERWLGRIRKHQHCTFGDVCSIKVGIKTTADPVFIREDWSEPGTKSRPEPDLILPLITHHVAARWSAESDPVRHVLYPYDLSASKRTIVSAKEHPCAFRYLKKHRRQLESRKYLIDSGRKWFEIWVPHQPADWAAPKIVWPDISVEPKFFLDTSGAIVGGDSYWIKLNPDADPDWLYLMLGVANSTAATQFYDTVFHNKLYAGRRRFMTQYVKQFPLPDLKSRQAGKIVRLAKKLVKKKTTVLEMRMEAEVQSVFGF